MIFLGPFLWIIILLPIFAVGYLLKVVVQFVIDSTSVDQMPAYLARRFAAQEKYEEACRWHIEALLSERYESLLGRSLYGPRRGEAMKFLKAHAEKLPRELLEVMRDLLWSYAFLNENKTDLADSGNDGSPLRELAAQLVVSAHSPKEKAKIQRLHSCADYVQQSAPELATTLRYEPVPARKYPPKPVASPVEPDRAAVKSPRGISGACSLCGGLGDWKGLDLYAAVRFAFSRRSEMPSGGTISWSYTRFVGRWEVPFCPKCLSPSLIQESYKREMKKVKYGGVFASLAGVSLFVLSTIGVSNPWPFAIVILGGIASLISLFINVPKIWSRSDHEQKFYVDYVNRFSMENKADLMSGCDIIANVLHYQKTQYEPTADNLHFLVEPVGSKTIFNDESGKKWMQ